MATITFNKSNMNDSHTKSLIVTPDNFNGESHTMAPWAVYNVLNATTEVACRMWTKEGSVHVRSNRFSTADVIREAWLADNLVWRYLESIKGQIDPAPLRVYIDGQIVRVNFPKAFDTENVEVYTKILFARDGVYNAVNLEKGEFSNGLAKHEVLDHMLNGSRIIVPCDTRVAKNKDGVDTIHRDFEKAAPKFFRVWDLDFETLYADGESKTFELKGSDLVGKAHLEEYLKYQNDEKKVERAVNVALVVEQTAVNQGAAPTLPKQEDVSTIKLDGKDVPFAIVHGTYDVLNAEGRTAYASVYQNGSDPMNPTRIAKLRNLAIAGYSLKSIK